MLGPYLLGYNDVNQGIYTGDAKVLCEDIPDESIDFIMTDPPYPEEFLPLWSDLGCMAARVLKPSGFMVSYSGKLHLDKVMQRLDEHLAWYWQIILLLPGARSRIAARAMFGEWRPILVYSKSPRKRNNQWGPDVLKGPAPSKKYHEWGQSLPPVMELIERFSKPGELIFDPFCGGGTTPASCKMLSRNYLAFEIEPQTATIARKRLIETPIPLPNITTTQLDLNL